MNCLVCGRPMIVVEYKQIELDYCPNCYGVWFDAGELELLLEASGTGKAAQPRKAGVKTAEKARHCPVCRRKMDKARLGGESGPVIDTCPEGCGLWFDGGEVEQAFAGAEGQVTDFIRDVFRPRK